jgi:hypothetical protein
MIQEVKEAMWDIDWKWVRGALVGGVLVAVTSLIIQKVLEVRRRVILTVRSYRFGPSMSAHTFMGSAYPSDDSISMECDVSFFSNKISQTGLHNFRFEFCRSTYMGRIVELSVRERLHRDFLKETYVGLLTTLDLPSRSFVSVDIFTVIGRSQWEALRSCDFVQLTCETPEGKTRRFAIGPIHFPNMPPEGRRGPEYMRTFIDSKNRQGGQLIIKTERESKAPQSLDYRPGPDETRYWSGEDWVREIEQAKVYKDMKVAREEGDNLKIWDRVPKEWLDQSDEGGS